MPPNSIILLPLIFGFSILLAALIYFVGSRLSPEISGESPGEFASYASGEDMPFEEAKIDLERFFVFALYFLIFDVFAFLIATSFNTAWPLPTIYALVILSAVAMMVMLRGAK